MQRVGFGRFQIGHAVLNKLNFLRCDVVDVRQKVDAPAAHYYQSGRAAGNFLNNDFLSVRGLAQNGVQHRDERFFQSVQKRQQVNTALSTENPEFVLQQTHVGIAGIDKGRGLDIVFLPVLTNDDLDLGRVFVRFRVVRIIQGYAKAAFRAGLALPGQVQGDGAHHILVESSNAALAGQIGGDIGDFHGKTRWHWVEKSTVRPAFIPGNNGAGGAGRYPTRTSAARRGEC